MTIPKNWERKITFLYLFKKKKNSPLRPGHWVMSYALLPSGYQFKSPLHQKGENIVSILMAVQCFRQKWIRGFSSVLSR